MMRYTLSCGPWRYSKLQSPSRIALLLAPARALRGMCCSASSGFLFSRMAEPTHAIRCDADYLIKVLPAKSFRTIVVDLTPRQSEAIYVAQQAFVNRGHISPKIKQDILDLEKIFDAVIEDLGPVFVKFDGKGFFSFAADINNSLSRNLFKTKLSRMKHRDDVDIFWSWRELMVQSLRTCTGFDVIKQLVQGRRISIAKATKVYLREFKELNPELRMRAVVFHGALTALTPVLPNFSRKLLRDRHIIEDAVKTMFEEVKTKLPFRDYILDFAFDKTDRCYLTDIKTFNRSVPLGLFSWVRDQDVLQGNTFEFRIETSPPSPDQSYFKHFAPAWVWLVEERFDEVHPAVTLMKKVMLVSGVVVIALVVAYRYML